MINAALCHLPSHAFKLIEYLNFFFISSPTIEISHIPTPHLTQSNQRIMLIGDEFYCMLLALYLHKHKQQKIFYTFFDIYNSSQPSQFDPVLRISTNELKKFLADEEIDIAEFRGLSKTAILTSQHCVIKKSDLRIILINLITKHEIILESTTEIQEKLFDNFRYHSVDCIFTLFDVQKINDISYPDFFKESAKLTNTKHCNRFVIDYIIEKKQVTPYFNEETIVTINSKYYEKFSFREIITEFQYIIRIFVNDKNKDVICELNKHVAKSNEGRIDLLITQYPREIIFYLRHIISFKKEFANHSTVVPETSMIISNVFPVMILYNYGSMRDFQNGQESKKNYILKCNNGVMNVQFITNENENCSLYDLDKIADRFASF